MHDRGAAVVPVEVDVAREQHRRRERRELDRNGDGRHGPDRKRVPARREQSEQVEDEGGEESGDQERAPQLRVRPDRRDPGLGRVRRRGEADRERGRCAGAERERHGRPPRAGARSGGKREFVRHQCDLTRTGLLIISTSPRVGSSSQLAIKPTR